MWVLDSWLGGYNGTFDDIKLVVDSHNTIYNPWIRWPLIHQGSLLTFYCVNLSLRQSCVPCTSTSTHLRCSFIYLRMLTLFELHILRCTAHLEACSQSRGRQNIFSCVVSVDCVSEGCRKLFCCSTSECSTWAMSKGWTNQPRSRPVSSSLIVVRWRTVDRSASLSLFLSFGCPLLALWLSCNSTLL